MAQASSTPTTFDTPFAGVITASSREEARAQIRKGVTRRGIAAGAIGFGALAIPAVAAAPPSHLSRLNHEATALRTLTASLNARDDVTAKEWSDWSEREKVFLREVEALPPTAETARLKARAITQIYEGQLEDWGEGFLTDRLARQIVRSLAGVA
jgi:hypothetical protein